MTTAQTGTILDQLTEHGYAVLIPRPREPGPPPDTPVARRWYSTREVADMLGYGLSKTKMLVTTGQLRSIKDGKYRRILPEWVDEYVNRRVEEQMG